MCQIYASTSPERYDSVTHSFRIQGCVTSIRLEQEFWGILKEMAEAENQTLPELINVLHSEVHQNYGEVRNFTSFLRTSCTIYLARKDSSIETIQPMDESATALSH
ncbi:MAG: DNA-binding protein [Gammaproteobacteria bacterium]|nr:DNA-binding protein [Gammaproteobacteria bacterium]